jgi:hypothetical protein
MNGNRFSPVFLLLAIWVVSAAPAAAQSHGPLLEILPNPVDFDTVFCGSSRCIDVTLRNAGDTALTVQSFDALGPPFSGSIETPLVLQPGQQHSAQWCYAPTRVLTRDSISVRLVSDNRISYSFGYLVDGSDAMRAAFPGAGDAIDAAHDALTIFVTRMMADGSPPHEGATFTYSTSPQFRLLRGLTDERALVLGSIPGNASGAHACIWQGMDRGIALMQSARHRRVLIVVNGSEDAGPANCGPYSAPGVASAAIAADMLVYTISINGAASSALGDIARLTGGLHHDVASMAEIEQAMTDITQHLQRAVRQQFVVRGEVVSPSLAFVPSAVLFPSIAAGDTARSTVWLRNIGTSPMEIGEVRGGTGVFRIAMTKETVMPGDSLPAEVSFFPATQAYSSTVITADINGCDPDRRTLTLRGMSYLPVNPSPGPVLAAGARVIDGGGIPCDRGGAISVSLRNVGDKPLRAFQPVAQCGTVLPPDTSEWEVEAGAERSLLLRVTAGLQPGSDSCGFHVTTLSRRSTTSMIVIDASSALRTPWQGIDGMGACQLAIGVLSAGMSRTAELQDRMGVLSASLSGVQSMQSMTEDRRALTSIVPAAGFSDTTALLAAIEAALDTLVHYDGIRRVFILTAGSTDASALTGGPAVEALARRAAASGTRITAVALGSDAISDSLSAFLIGSGSERRSPADPDALIDFLGEIETRSVDTLQRSWMLRWTNISSDMTVTPDALVFGESYAGEPGCMEVTISNPGEVPLEILDVSSSTNGFSCGTSLPLVVPIGGSAALRLCYEPPVLGAWSLEAVIRGNSCIHPTVTVRMQGEATDSNAVQLAGTFIARPGGLVAIPVRMEHVLPALHDVHRMTLRIAYDPSLLYPDMDAPLANPAGSASGYTVTVKQEYDGNSGRAVSTYDVSSSAGSAPIVSAGADNTLFSLRLRAFLGRAVKTDVALLDATFPESAVALGFSGSATVRIDSMQWLEDRLVDASALWGVLGKNAPNPSRGRSVISYALRAPMSVRLALFDLHGRLLRIAFEGYAAEGRHQAVIDTRGLAAGAYVCRLESRAGTLSRMLLVSNQEGK